MMNAKEALKIARDAHEGQLRRRVYEAGPKALELYAEVERLIPEACERGEFYVKTPLPDGLNTVESVAVCNLLQALGYDTFRPHYEGVEHLMARWDRSTIKWGPKD